MGCVLLNAGEFATTPYYFEQVDVNIYSIEELCYLLAENSFLVDEKIVTQHMIDWIGGECHLPELARHLYPFVSQRGSAASFVSSILEYTGYYDENRIKEIEEIIKSSAGMSLCEKKKTQIDYMLRSRKYSQALWEYDKLLAEIPSEEVKTRSMIYHNEGVALAEMFLFDRAAELFKLAFEQTGDEEEQRSYLAAMRMYYDDKDYVSFIAERPQDYDASLKLEQEVDEILTVWENSEQYKSLQELRGLRQNGKTALYYDETENAVDKLKNIYRAEIAD